MSAARRIFGACLRQIDERLSLTRSSQADDRIALEVVQSSRVFALVEQAAERVGAAARSSALLRAADTMQRGWQRHAWHARVRAVGTMLIVAGLTHAILGAAAATQAGWLWLVFPCVAIVSGAWLVVVSTFMNPSTTLS